MAGNKHRSQGTPYNKNTDMISVHIVNMHIEPMRMSTSLQKPMQYWFEPDSTWPYFITFKLNFKALLRNYKLLSLAIFVGWSLSLVYQQLCTVITKKCWLCIFTLETLSWSLLLLFDLILPYVLPWKDMWDLHRNLEIYSPLRKSPIWLASLCSWLPHSF